MAGVEGFTFSLVGIILIWSFFLHRCPKEPMLKPPLFISLLVLSLLTGYADAEAAYELNGEP